MEKVLDIDNIFGGRGFIASSGDDNDEVAQFSVAKSKLSSRLATLFAEDEPSTSTFFDENTSLLVANKREPASSTIFSSTVYLYLFHNEQYVSKGRVGVAVVKSSTSDILVFYNSSKEAILCLPLGDGKISRIEKRQKYCVLSSSLKTISFICLSDSDETKLIALLMILCSVECTILEVGDGDEVKMGSSILFDSSSFIFSGSSVEVSTDGDSKLRLSSKSDPWIFRLTGMMKSGKCMIRKDEKTVVLLHIKKVKNPANRGKNEIIKSTVLVETTGDQMRSGAAEAENVGSESDTEKSLDENRLRQRMALIGRPILPGAEKNSDIFLNASIQPSEERSSPTPSFSADVTDFSDKVQQEQQQPPFEPSREPFHPTQVDGSSRMNNEGSSSQPLNDYSALHRIVGVEIDRLEIRLEAALERMVDHHFHSIKEEMRQVKDKQEAILRKLEGFKKADDGDL